MVFNTKKLEDITEKDLREIEKKPVFENLQVEFKFRYNKNPDELRKDIVQFANSHKGGIVFYGVQENPLKFVGLDYDEVDKIKVTINNIIPRKIDPLLSQYCAECFTCCDGDYFIDRDCFCTSNSWNRHLAHVYDIPFYYMDYSQSSELLW